MDIRSLGSGSPVKVYGWNTAGTVLSGATKPNSTIDVYKNGTKDGSTTSDAQGLWSYTFASAPAPADNIGLRALFDVTTTKGRPIYVAPVLNTLSLSNTAATAGSAFSSMISGLTAGSTVTATASDGTALSVSGSTVSGTFSASGTPTISLVETLAGATGSPKTTTVQISVASSGGQPSPTNFYSTVFYPLLAA